ncbi:extracellular solute-binding protein [Geodermatophilus sp. SYSU D00698]
MTGLSRRQFLAAGGSVSLAVAMSGCASPIATSFTGGQPRTADVIFWHLFGGGDGENMATMVETFQESSAVSIESSLLSWGNPFYTKLALSTSSGRPPDVTVAHLSRVPLLAQAGLLEPVADQFRAEGITEDRFTPAAWEKATVDGVSYAVPLDTHPYALYYNVELAEQAGLLDASGENLRPMRNSDEFVATLQAMKDATGGEYAAVAPITVDPSSCWRLFLMTYSGLAGPLLEDLGTEVTIDRAAMEESFAFLQGLTGELGLLPSTATATTASTLFSQGRVGFLFDGVWQIPTYREVEGLDFNVVPFPALLGPEPVAYADSHALVVPASPGRSATRTENAVRFVKGLLDQSSTWADGGHVPAWLPVQESEEFLALEPQSNYTEAAFNAVYDPPGWYTGAGSDFQTAMGSVIASVLTGATDPARGVDAMTSSLQTFSTARPPV